jgi:hypothetical protein
VIPSCHGTRQAAQKEVEQNGQVSLTRIGQSSRVESAIQSKTWRQLLFGQYTAFVMCVFSTRNNSKAACKSGKPFSSARHFCESRSLRQTGQGMGKTFRSSAMKAKPSRAQVTQSVCPQLPRATSSLNWTATWQTGQVVVSSPPLPTAAVVSGSPMRRQQRKDESQQSSGRRDSLRSSSSPFCQCLVYGDRRVQQEPALPRGVQERRRPQGDGGSHPGAELFFSSRVCLCQVRLLNLAWRWADDCLFCFLLLQQTAVNPFSSHEKVNDFLGTRTAACCNKESKVCLVVNRRVAQRLSRARPKHRNSKCEIEISILFITCL